MTDLSNKFSGFEGLVGGNHTELMAALNTIAFALGAPPTTPNETLADVMTILTTINSNIVQMRSASALYHSSALSLIGAINTNTDTIINNNSLNAQRMIAAILSTICPCESAPALLAPPIDVTPTPLIDDAKCRRIQFYLSVFGQWLYKIANYAGAGAFITGDVLATLLGAAAAEAGIVATGAEIGAAAGPPGVVVGAVVGLLVGAVAILGGSVLLDYATQFNAPTMQGDLLAALYAADNADAGYTAFKNVITANMAEIPAQIIYTLWWSAWSNDIYSGSPVVDDSAFDGSICAPAGPTTVLTESCVDRINQIVGANYTSATYDATGYTHMNIGIAGGGGGVGRLFVNGIEVETINIQSSGATRTWIGTGTSVHYSHESTLDVYVHLTFCTGTYS
jgi:hypothetical protein